MGRRYMREGSFSKNLSKSIAFEKELRLNFSETVTSIPQFEDQNR